MKNKNDLLGALILKWLKEGIVSIKKVETKKLFKIKEEDSIVFNTTNIDNELEKEIFDMMYEASVDGILESGEFKKWCSTNYKKILNWFDDVLDKECDIFKNNGKCMKEEIVTFKVFKENIYKFNDSLYEDAIKLKGLKNYLNEFSLIKDKEVIQVNLWEYYLIYAQIFGIAEKVAKEFKELYPDLVTDYSYDDIIFISTISHTGMVSATSARSRAESYSSGGGGFSSGGGGGGSFGGGGGGGGFR